MYKDIYIYIYIGNFKLKWLQTWRTKKRFMLFSLIEKVFIHRKYYGILYLVTIKKFINDKYYIFWAILYKICDWVVIKSIYSTTIHLFLDKKFYNIKL